MVSGHAARTRLQIDHHHRNAFLAISGDAAAMLRRDDADFLILDIIPPYLFSTRLAFSRSWRCLQVSAVFIRCEERSETP